MTQVSPLVSIIVPVYNAEKYLRYCVDSILRQSYEHLEIILVDDGATDSSPMILDEYQRRDNRVRVTHQTNGGIAKAQNAGLDAAITSRSPTTTTSSTAATSNCCCTR